ncbi:TPA: hypothetical protein R4Y92_001447 [Klebsiella aerogenes]|nr:hypothetical protein [Klebsiella aerogenes]
MGYGLLQAGQSTRKEAMQGMGQAANEEAQREAAQKQIDAQETAQRESEQGAFTAMNIAGLAMEIAACF